MKTIAGILFFLIALILCTVFARPIHQAHIERDLSRKVSHVLIEYGLDHSGVVVKDHHLIKIKDVPSTDSAREELRKDLDEIIGLYVDMDAVVPPLDLTPPSFHLAEQADESIILTGLIRDESERAFLVDLAATSATEKGGLRSVIDQLELTEDVARIQPKEGLSTLTPALLSNSEKGFVSWSPSDLTIGGLIENEEQESSILDNSTGIVTDGTSPLNELKVQPFQDLDFGIERKENKIIVNGLLPDIETRDRLLKLVKLQAKDSRVIDNTSLALRSNSRWWENNPETFIPAFLSGTTGPAQLHYFHDRFVAKGTFSDLSAYKTAQRRIAHYPRETKRETKLGLITKPTLTLAPGTPPPVSVAAGTLVDELKALAVYFASSSSYIKNKEDKKIEAAALLILASKDVTQGLTVGGFADLRGNANYNRNLSLARAKAVRARLISKGVPATRLTVNHFGEDTSKTSRKDLWKSRRVEISLTKAPDQ